MSQQLHVSAIDVGHRQVVRHEYLSVSYTGIWVVKWLGGEGSESARSRIIKKGAWAGVCAVGNIQTHVLV
jgi:hypothetical protein